MLLDHHLAHGLAACHQCCQRHVLLLCSLQDHPCRAIGQELRVAPCSVLQVKEVALMHSEGILAGEMKHGPLALVWPIPDCLILSLWCAFAGTSSTAGCIRLA